MIIRLLISLCSCILCCGLLSGQEQIHAPPQSDLRLYQIASAPSAQRIEKDIRKLVSFGTRNTLSDTISNERGIGAARRWIKHEFEQISKRCNECLDVYFQRNIVPEGTSRRLPKEVEIVNVIAIQKGTEYSDRYVIMSGDIDSRASRSTDATTDSPGANDNASGMAGVLEAARVLSQYKFKSNIVYAGLSGEEQGLFGGKFMAEQAKKDNWDIIGVLNNDMIGNIEGIDGVIENNTFRVFSEPVPVGEDERKKIWRRFYGGEVDGPSRQLARYIDNLTTQYCPNLTAMMIYRLDRFGRGGHHRPFNDLGFPRVRIMETHENYNRQHQDVRREEGISYGDVIEGVNFDYAAKLTGVNTLTLAALAWAPSPPESLMIGGAVSPSTRLKWDDSNDPNIIGYKIYWRETTAPQWQYHRFVGKVNDYTLNGIVIDNYLFGVSAVNANGNESLVSFPNTLIPRNQR